MRSRLLAVVAAATVALGSCGQLNIVADETRRECDRALDAGEEMASAGVTLVTRGGPLLGARGWGFPRPPSKAERRAALREFEVAAEAFVAAEEQWDEWWAKCWTSVGAGG